MHILLTNDDGVYAEGIYAIYAELRKWADVTVVAPDSERSSVGHGITLAHPIYFKKINRKGKPFGFGISGMPADCVKFGVSVILKKKPDLIVSGINFGANDGTSVFYSGTVAGAREGAIMGIPAIALSLGTFVNPNFAPAAKVGSQLVKVLAKQRMPKGSFINVNIPPLPASKIKGIRICRQGTQPIHEEFLKRIDPGQRQYYWMTGRMPVIRHDDETDTYALKKGYVTVTPIHCDLTDHPFLSELKANASISRVLRDAS